MSRKRADTLRDFGVGSQTTRTIDSEHLKAIANAFNSEATAIACFKILSSTILSGGVTVTRAGEPVDLTPAFQLHLDTVWTSFARQAILSIVKYGIVPVTLSKPAPPPFGAKPRKGEDQNKVPIVLDAATISVQITQDGPRTLYTVVDDTLNPMPEAHVFVHNVPTADTGRCSSPMSALLEHVEFVQRLDRYALDCEQVRSRFLITTSVVSKTDKDAGPISSANLFFDANSRAIDQSNEADEDQRHYKNLELAAALASELNRSRGMRQPNGAAGGAPSMHAHDDVPVRPALFAAPSGQQIVPTRPPEARNDLVEVRAQLGQRISTAFGVPSAFLNEGARFSANAECQLRAFNSTSQSLATFLNSVLSTTYDYIYGTDDAERVIVTPQQVTPLADIVKLFQSQLVSREALAPVAMQLVGLSKEEVDAEMKRQEKLAAEAPGAPAAPTAPSGTSGTSGTSSTSSTSGEGDTDGIDDDDDAAAAAKRERERERERERAAQSRKKAKV